MAYKIGFTTDTTEQKKTESVIATSRSHIVPRKSVVQVHFPDANTTLSYFNSDFDLKIGDFVFVEGSFKGIRGRVVDIIYNFKIKLENYKKVISVADTTVSGEFFLAESHFMTFDRNSLPKKKVLSWFKPDTDIDEEFAIGFDDTTFCLDNLHSMEVSPAVAKRGHNYYLENKVKYLSIDGTSGYAIVTGSEPYEVEFEYQNGEISKIICSCFCSYNCKHEFATMLQLQEIIRLIESEYADQYKNTGYFSIIDKSTFFTFAIDGKKSGKFTI